MTVIWILIIIISVICFWLLMSSLLFNFSMILIWNGKKNLNLDPKPLNHFTLLLFWWWLWRLIHVDIDGLCIDEPIASSGCWWRWFFWLLLSDKWWFNDEMDCDWQLWKKDGKKWNNLIRWPHQRSQSNKHQFMKSKRKIPTWLQ